MNDKTWTNEFSLRLGRALYNANMSQAELALKVGIDRKAINRYFSGQCLPNVFLLSKMAKELKTDPNNLIGFEWYEE